MYVCVYVRNVCLLCMSLVYICGYVMYIRMYVIDKFSYVCVLCMLCMNVRRLCTYAMLWVYGLSMFACMHVGLYMYVYYVDMLCILFCVVVYYVCMVWYFMYAYDVHMRECYAFQHTLCTCSMHVCFVHVYVSSMCMCACTFLYVCVYVMYLSLLCLFFV